MATYTGPNIVSDGLVLCLDAGNSKSYPGSGDTWYNLSGNSNATRQGNASYVTWNSSGYFQHRPTGYFGGADASSSAPDSSGSWWQVSHTSAISPNGSWTVGGWMKVIGDQTGNGTGWFHKAGSGDERGIHLEPINGEFRANASDGWSQINYNIDNSGVWANYFFVFTQTSGTYGTDPGNIKFYINGSQVFEDTSFTPKIDSTSPIYLCRRNGHLRHFLYGDVATYYYYTKSLSQQEVLNNFLSTRNRFGI